MIGAGVLGAVVVTAGGLAVNHVQQDPSFRVEAVEIVGNQRASVAQLRHLADVAPEAHLGTVQLDHVRRGVERHPWVRQATVSRAFPSTLRIEVVEHQPVLLLSLDQLWYLDADGRPIKRAEADDLDYPVITGLSPALADQRPELAAAVVAGALRVLAACDGHPVYADDISEIHHDPTKGYELVLRSGTRLILGSGSPQAPFTRLQRMVELGLDLDTPQRIDLDIESVAVATPLPPA
ncbi:MAG: FtsQ-type POTRA domain-containing protein [Alphaproteobacteria bacterium]|nr:FtsQ-type POTRA domain-containing protein [Alphaproteobacteria bacterium]